MKDVAFVMIMGVVALSLNASAQEFSITIDGERDAWYSGLTGPENGLVFMPAACCVPDIGTEETRPDPNDDDDLSAIVWFAYDANYMYVYAEVTDDLVLATNTARYLNDCLELKFDPIPSAMSTGARDNTRLSALSEEQSRPGVAVDNLSGLGDWVATEGADYVRRLSNDGYVLEFRLPLDNIESTDGKLRDNETGTFGMAVNVCENDDTDRSAMLQWSAGHTDKAHPEPIHLGSVTFMPNHILKFEAISPQDPNIINENAEEWYTNPNIGVWGPKPPDGATDVPRDRVLSWLPGKNGESFDVYFGTDANDVKLVSGGQEVMTYDPPDLLGFGQTYYWRIDEVNDLDPGSPWKGPVWSFTTRDYITLEDFDSYTDDWNNIIFQTWIDGYGWNDPNGSSGEGNGSGAAVGYWPPPTVEKTIRYDGRQSMPLSYGFDAKTLSETTRTWNEPEPVSDGVKTMSLQFYGFVANSPGQLFLKINGQKVSDYPGAQDDMKEPEWHSWTIDLVAAGITSIESMTIGITGGAGTVYIDAIRLHPTAD